jgi:hypothetical protein
VQLKSTQLGSPVGSYRAELIRLRLIDVLNVNCLEHRACRRFFFCVCCFMIFRFHICYSECCVSVIKYLKNGKWCIVLNEWLHGQVDFVAQGNWGLLNPLEGILFLVPVATDRHWWLTAIVVGGSRMASRLGMAVVLAQVQVGDGGTLQSNKVVAVVDLGCSKAADINFCHANLWWKDKLFVTTSGSSEKNIWFRYFASYEAKGRGWEVWCWMLTIITHPTVTFRVLLWSVLSAIS